MATEAEVREDIRRKTLESALQGAPSPNLEDSRERLVTLFDSIEQTYVDLINAGRVKEAADLREAAERYARVGAKAGVNEFARLSAMNDLKRKMRTAAGATESRVIADKLNQQIRAAEAIANLDRSSFTQAMQSAQETRSARTQALSLPDARERDEARRLSATARGTGAQRVAPAFQPSVRTGRTPEAQSRVDAVMQRTLDAMDRGKGSTFNRVFVPGTASIQTPSDRSLFGQGRMSGAGQAPATVAEARPVQEAPASVRGTRGLTTGKTFTPTRYSVQSPESQAAQKAEADAQERGRRLDTFNKVFDASEARRKVLFRPAPTI